MREEKMTCDHIATNEYKFYKNDMFGNNLP